VIDRAELTRFVAIHFHAYHDEPQTAPLDLAQHLVLGAIEYARRLGFEPHPDFEKCRGHLGPWAGPAPIEFGYRGEAYFIQGPHDDVATILRTLDRSVGRGNFKCVVLDDLA
jgi:hypothetical protein